MRAGSREAAGNHAAHGRSMQGRTRLQIWVREHARAERTSNMDLMLVTLEVVVKLSGLLNALAYCRESKGAYSGMRCERCEPGGRRQRVTLRSARSVHRGRARLQMGQRARAGRGAHVEHGAHACDAGGFPRGPLDAGGVQEVRIERRRGLPRDERGAYDVCMQVWVRATGRSAPRTSSPCV